MRTLIFGFLLALAARAANMPTETRQLIPLLGDKQFARRQEAQQQLVKLGDANCDAVLADCVTAYAQATDPEIKTRLREVMAKLVETHILQRPRGFLGIQLMPAPAGVQIAGVTEDTPAERAGLQAGDQITKIDKLDLPGQNATEAFTTYVRSQTPGTKVELVILRAEKPQTVPVELGQMPAETVRQLDRRMQDPDRFFQDWLHDALAKQQNSR